MEGLWLSISCAVWTMILPKSLKSFDLFPSCVYKTSLKTDPRRWFLHVSTTSPHYGPLFWVRPSSSPRPASPPAWPSWRGAGVAAAAAAGSRGSGGAAARTPSDQSLGSVCGVPVAWKVGEKHRKNTIFNFWCYCALVSVGHINHIWHYNVYGRVFCSVEPDFPDWSDFTWTQQHRRYSLLLPKLLRGFLSRWVSAGFFGNQMVLVSSSDDFLQGAYMTVLPEFWILSWHNWNYQKATCGNVDNKTNTENSWMCRWKPHWLRQTRKCKRDISWCHAMQCGADRVNPAWYDIVISMRSHLVRVVCYEAMVSGKFDLVVRFSSWKSPLSLPGPSFHQRSRPQRMWFHSGSYFYHFFYLMIFDLVCCFQISQKSSKIPNPQVPS